MHLGIIVALSWSLGVESESTRVVVTFRSATYNTLEAAELVPDDIAVVKQYGRRLVLHLGNETFEHALQVAGVWGEQVERVEPDGVVATEGFNNSLPEQPPWHLDPSEPFGLHLDNALVTRKNASIVALLDSGLAAVASGLWTPVSGFCFISSPDFTNTNLGRNPDYTDPGDQGPACPSPSWHGTKVASVVKAVAPNAKLSILRVLGQCGKGFASDVTDAIVWAAGGWINGVRTNPSPAKVISMSLAGKGPCPTFMQSAVNQALGLGATILAAAGNAGANATLYFPGNCRGVLSIGASTRQGTLAAYSNWGETLAFSAPGGDGTNPVHVLSVGPDALLVPATAVGTSFAAPHVSGVVAMLQAINVSLEQGGRYVPCVGGCGARGILNGAEKGPASDEVQRSDSYCFPYYIACTTYTIPCNCICQDNYFYHAYMFSEKTMLVGCLCNRGFFSGSSYVCFPCPPGSFSNVVFVSPYYDRVTSCSLCAAGTYSTGTEASSSEVCLPCDSGKYSTALGAQSLATCVSCPEGTYSSGIGTSVCTRCSPGSFNSLRGATFSGACFLCETGKFSTSSGAVSENSCVDCSPGYFSSSSSSTSCSACLPGKYSSAPRARECSNCIDRSTYSTGSGAIACTTCLVNSCGQGTTLQPCTKTSEGVCTNCKMFPNCMYTGSAGCFISGSSTIPSCTCAAGFQMDGAANAAAATVCVQCPPGTWKNTGNAEVCKPWMNASQCSSGQFLVFGNRRENSKCLNFPGSAPANAVVPFEGFEWVCNAGYEKYQ